MARFLFTSPLLLLSLPARAQEQPIEVPLPDGDPTAMIIVGILLVLMVGSYFAFMWWNERTRK
jgi:drug/metabolite transporter (DMT)-like permease